MFIISCIFVPKVVFFDNKQINVHDKRVLNHCLTLVIAVNFFRINDNHRNNTVKCNTILDDAFFTRVDTLLI